MTRLNIAAPSAARNSSCASISRRRPPFQQLPRHHGLHHCKRGSHVHPIAKSMEKFDATNIRSVLQRRVRRPLSGFGMPKAPGSNPNPSRLFPKPEIRPS
jgi:hypothetical protein